jgi:hypothetical protein
LAKAEAYFELYQGFEMNHDYKKRDEIMDLNVTWGKDDFDELIWVELISLPVLEKLVEERFVDPESRQNASPTVQAFLEFMRKYPSVTAHGYVVSPERPDYRVSIEGLFVAKKKVTPELKQEFINLCKDADELRMDGDLFSWWD